MGGGGSVVITSFNSIDIMIHFNELYVTEDGKNLVIDAEIDDLDIYENCFITNVLVDVGENCDGNGKSVNALVKYNGTPILVGDADNDGALSKKEIDIWKNLHGLAFAIENGGKKLRYDETKGWWFKSQTKDDDGNYIDVYVTDEFVNLAEEIRTTYRDYILDKEPGTENMSPGQVLAYISDLFGIFSITSETSTIMGDINGDGEVSIPDFNQFVDYILACYNKTAPYIFVGQKTKHFRKCYSVNDLAPLVESGTDLSSKLFIVTVHADCYGDVTAIAEADCGSDVNEITGVAYNGKPLYDSAVSAASSYGDTCDTKDATAFEDFVLRYYGFLFALKCGDLCKAQYYWENYLNVGKTSCKRAYTKPCGCHGLY